MFEQLTAYLPRRQMAQFSEQFPYVNYDSAVNEFVDAVYSFLMDYPEMKMRDYSEIREQSNIQWNSDSMISLLRL